MKKMTLLLTMGTMLAIPVQALAYIDPTAGGLLVQLLLAGIAGVAVIARLYWSKLTGPFRRRWKRQSQK